MGNVLTGATGRWTVGEFDEYIEIHGWHTDWVAIVYSDQQKLFGMVPWVWGKARGYRFMGLLLDAGWDFACNLQHHKDN